MVWWRSVHLDDVHAILSTTPVGWILVRSLAELKTISSVTGRNAYSHFVFDSFVPSNYALQCLEAYIGAITIFSDSIAAAGHRGRPLLYALDDWAAAAALVQLHFA